MSEKKWYNVRLHENENDKAPHFLVPRVYFIYLVCKNSAIMSQVGGMDDQLMREEARIRRKREENAKRRDRFLNARKRIMGVDVEALDAQVQEKKDINQGGRDDDALERLKSLEIERVLEEAKEEERLMREFQKAQLKESWDNAVSEHQYIKAQPEVFLDPLKAGPSAAQKFAGSDPNRGSRLRAQQDQMRRWIQEQMHEKAEAASTANDGDIAYGNMMKAVEEIRDAADIEEKEMKSYLNKTVTESNAALIAAKRQRAIDASADWDRLTPQQQAAASSIDLRECENLAMDENGRIARRDAFRGYSQAQVRHIIQENEDLLTLKRQQDTASDDADDVWVKQQQMQMQAMEHANYMENAMRESETQLNLEVLKQQIALQKQRRNNSNKERFGSITSGFFDQFGQDCR